MASVERDRQVLARANYYTQIFPRLITLGGVSFDAKRKEAWDQKKVSFVPPEEPMRMPVALINQRIGRLLDEIRQRDQNEMRRRMNTSAIKSTFSENIVNYRTSKLNSAFTQFISNNLHSTNCKKIVAFGGYSLGVAQSEAVKPANAVETDPERKDYSETEEGLSLQIQHAAVLSIRRSLETLHPTDPPIPIILQDPEYTEDDKETAESLDMTIVNGNFGYEKRLG
jgi:hypothetical protein